ncbi:hypothetical protein ABPG72_020062 [Tetrahymena utriculariae]
MEVEPNFKDYLKDNYYNSQTIGNQPFPIVWEWQQFKRWAVVISSLVWEKSLREIAEKLDCSFQWVSKMVKQYLEGGSLIYKRSFKGGKNRNLNEEVLDSIQQAYQANRVALNRQVIAEEKQKTGIIPHQKMPKICQVLQGQSPKQQGIQLHQIQKKDMIIHNSTQMILSKTVYSQMNRLYRCLKINLWYGGSLVMKKDQRLLLNQVKKDNDLGTDEKETMNSKTYLQTLKNFAEDQMDNEYGFCNWRLMHDNCKVHKAKIISDWIIENTIIKINHPAYSPDLNPIEKVWNIIKQSFFQKAFNDIEELFEAVKNGWYKLDFDLIDKLIANHIKQVKNIHKNKGLFIDSVTANQLYEHELSQINFVYIILANDRLDKDGQSYPDLSPIENVWAVIKDQLYVFKDQIKNSDDLFNSACEIFYNFDIIQQTIRNSYNSMKKRIEQVYIQEGDNI